MLRFCKTNLVYILRTYLHYIAQVPFVADIAIGVGYKDIKM
jgi:hypothetical protein